MLRKHNQRHLQQKTLECSDVTTSESEEAYLVLFCKFDRLSGQERRVIDEEITWLVSLDARHEDIMKPFKKQVRTQKTCTKLHGLKLR